MRRLRPPPSTRRYRRNLAGLPSSAPAPFGGLYSLRRPAPAPSELRPSCQTPECKPRTFTC
eukprot:12076212-Alexandrium_andersonii.AAC.1